MPIRSPSWRPPAVTMTSSMYSDRPIRRRRVGRIKVRGRVRVRCPRVLPALAFSAPLAFAGVAALRLMYEDRDSSSMTMIDGSPGWPPWGHRWTQVEIEITAGGRFEQKAGPSAGRQAG
jgi:hypothetical protein